jgi:hypothetical protein
MGTVIGVRNAAILAAATVVSNGLSALWLHFLGALRLCFLGALWLRFLGALWLCFLGALWLRFLYALRLRFLGALWLRFLYALRLRFLYALWLCFLGALRLRFLGALRLRFLRVLRLRFLCVLRLLLVLRRLGFSSALFLLLFLCECRKGGSEQYKHHCCADDSIVFHKCGLPTHFSSASH